MSGDQLQPEDTLDDRGVDDVLDEGYSPPERETDHLRHPEGGESLDDRLADEEPEVWAQAEAEADAKAVGVAEADAEPDAKAAAVAGPKAEAKVAAEPKADAKPSAGEAKSD